MLLSRGKYHTNDNAKQVSTQQKTFGTTMYQSCNITPHTTHSDALKALQRSTGTCKLLEQRVLSTSGTGVTSDTAPTNDQLEETQPTMSNALVTGKESTQKTWKARSMPITLK
mmetsp:Transcript_131817/g.381238  ORF Transcript_131817/g.381238 Transcript_131817/m.381238 type:complete len:113 (-) Transcript_131817:811-1149(-)